MTLDIKTLNNSYSQQVAELVLNIQQKEFHIAITLQDQPDLLAIEDFYISKGGNFWGAFINGELVGTIALIRFGNHSGAIRKMFVQQDFRGKELGIAQQLLDVLIAYCNQHDIKNLFLGTVSVLKAAQRFYERNRFTQIEKDLLPPDFPLMSADDIFYSLQLA